MARWMRDNQIDVVHTYNTFANCWGGIAALLARVPVLVCGEHGTIWGASQPLSWLERRIYRRADQIVANSQASVMMLNQRYGVKPERTRVVYNAVAQSPGAEIEEIRTELGFDRNCLVVGSIGRLDTPKDFFTFADAAAMVLSSRLDVRFVLVGGGPLETELRRHANRLRIASRFVLTGWRIDARALLQAFDVFVSTSIREPFGNVLVEAALAGIPTLAPRVDGIPEAVMEGVTGLLLTPTEPVRSLSSAGAAPLPKRVLIDGKLQTPRSLNPQELADRILHLLAQPDLRQRYGQAGRARAIDRFSIDRYVNELEGLYQGLGTARPRGS
jgi:glycosyltransferase involved in cell wall biosynthesis